MQKPSTNMKWLHLAMLILFMCAIIGFALLAAKASAIGYILFFSGSFGGLFVSLVTFIARIVESIQDKAFHFTRIILSLFCLLLFVIISLFAVFAIMMLSCGAASVDGTC